jgi:alpha-D-xyloside xylohydrolase
MVVEDILMMEALDILFTLYWVDRPWGPGRFGYDDFL